MKKNELIRETANLAEMSQRDVEQVYNALMHIIVYHLKEQGEARIYELGTFTTKQTKEVKRYNPLSRKEITIAPRIAVKFKSNKRLKEFLND